MKDTKAIFPAEKREMSERVKRQTDRLTDIQTRRTDTQTRRTDRQTDRQQKDRQTHTQTLFVDVSVALGQLPCVRQQIFHFLHFLILLHGYLRRRVGKRGKKQK
jgi:hypothetical protein